MAWSRDGGALPDFGVGIGHHGDEEYEYEIHHWEQHHTEEDGDEKFIHPEDIEHVGDLKVGERGGEGMLIGNSLKGMRRRRRRRGRRQRERSLRLI